MYSNLRITSCVMREKDGRHCVMLVLVHLKVVSYQSLRGKYVTKVHGVGVLPPSNGGSYEDNILIFRSIGNFLSPTRVDAAKTGGWYAQGSKRPLALLFLFAWRCSFSLHGSVQVAGVAARAVSFFFSLFPSKLSAPSCLNFVLEHVKKKQ